MTFVSEFDDFSPLSIAGCQYWLDAADLSTLKQNSAGTGAVANIGDPIGYWANKAGTAFGAATQATAAARPFLDKSGRPVVRFQYSSTDTVARSWMSMPNIASGFPTAATAICLFYYAGAPSAYNVFETSNNYSWVYTGSTGLGYLGWFRGTRANVLTSTYARQFLDVKMHLMAVRSGAAAYEIRRNGQRTYSDGGNYSAGGAFTLGYTHGAPYFAGFMCELLLYNSYLSDANLKLIERYLSFKWQVGVLSQTPTTPKTLIRVDNVVSGGTAAAVPTSRSRVIKTTSPSTFNPTSVPGLALWLDAKDHTTLTFTDSRVSQWSDKSGNNNHATQPTHLNRPAHFVDNSRQHDHVFFGFDFDNTNQDRLNVTVTQSKQYIFCVCRSPYTTWQYYTAPIETQAVDAAVRLGALFQQGNMAMHTNPRPLRVRKNGYELAQSHNGYLTEFDLTDITRWMVVTIKTARPTGSSSLFVNGLGGGQYSSPNAISELLVYGDLTEQQIQDIENYLMARHGIPGAPTVTHPEAQDWLTRVYQNGGTVTQADANAVNAFCQAIDAAGIRSKFYRLNLFCGDNSGAAAVPLYRGPSLGGTQYGHIRDARLPAPLNFFTGYAHTGDGAGLKGNGSNRYLNTGLATNFTTTTDLSFSVYCTEPETVAGRVHMHTATAAGANFTGIYFTGATVRCTDTSTTALPAAPTRIESVGLHTLVRTSSVAQTHYWNKNAGAASTNQTPATRHTVPFCVLAQNNNGSIVNYSNATVSAYHIGLSLTAAQVGAYYDALQAFQKAVGRLGPTVAHAEAQNWIDRVYANGGFVSVRTAQAVNAFCQAVDDAGIRDRFYRLNLFCGENLAACLVPLYRGQSLGGTQYGGETDTNSGFVASDYGERGATGGLTAGTSRHLNTGFNQNLIAVGSNHLAVYERVKASGAYQVSLGSRITSPAWTGFHYIGTDNPAAAYTYNNAESTGGRPILSSYPEAGAFFIGSNLTANVGVLYKNGAAAVTSTYTAATRVAIAQPYFVFALNDTGNATDRRTAGIIGGYSLGLGFTAAQAAAYNTVMQAFQTALERNV